MAIVKTDATPILQRLSNCPCMVVVIIEYDGIASVADDIDSAWQNLVVAPVLKRFFSALLRAVASVDLSRTAPGLCASNWQPAFLCKAFWYSTDAVCGAVAVVQLQFHLQGVNIERVLW